MKKEILDRPLNSLVEGILDSYEKYPLIRNIDSTNRINRAIVLEILENIRKIIFPGYFETRNLKQNSLSYHVGEILEDIHYNLTKQTARALQHREENPPGKRDRDPLFRRGGAGSPGGGRFSGKSVPGPDSGRPGGADDRRPGRLRRRPGSLQYG